MVSDNVLQDGDIIESRFAVDDGETARSISRMREYLYELKHDERLDTSILPIGDGVARQHMEENRKGVSEKDAKG